MDDKKVIYNWVLVYKADGTYMGWSKAKGKPHCGDANLEWIDWGKELPEDIDNDELSRDQKTGKSKYKVKNGKLEKHRVQAKSK